MWGSPSRCGSRACESRLPWTAARDGDDVCSPTCVWPAAGARPAASPCHREHLAPPAAGNQSRQCREPQPVAWLVTDPADLAAQDRVLVPEHQELGVLGRPVPRQHRQPAQQQVHSRNDHSAIIPAGKSVQARSSNRAPKDRWASDLARRRDAGIPDDLVFATKPQLAMDQLERLLAAGLPARWAAFDEVYRRSEKLRKQAAKAGLAYVAIIPCHYQVTLPSGPVIRADDAVKNAAFERRSCGNGSKGPRYSDWAMTATSTKGQSLLIRRLISRPEQLTFYLCWAPSGRPATMTYFITIAGSRWPVVEETFKTGKDVHGWDQSQARLFEAICRHTALAALAH